MPFKPGDNLILTDDKDREKLIQIPEAGESVALDGGQVSAEELMELHEGHLLKTRRRQYLVFSATLEQVAMNMPRQAQLIYPKDQGLILVWADIAPGQQVTEIGVGHGALTMALLRAMGPEGRLTSYDIREDHLNRTRKNIIRFLGEEFLERWDPILADPLSEGIKPGADRVICDVPEPWDMAQAVADGLKPGGVWLAWLPTVPQLIKQNEAINESKQFCMPKTFETMLRYWNVRPPSVRPEHEMKAHTGFVVVCRRRWRWGLDPD